MFPKSRFLKVCFPIVLILTSFLSLNKYPGYIIIDDQEVFRAISKKIPQKNQMNEFLVMFYKEIPKLTRFEPYIIKKFQNFPVIHIKFIDVGIKNLFIRTFHRDIYQMEPNRVFKNSPQVLNKEFNLIMQNERMVYGELNEILSELPTNKDIEIIDTDLKAIEDTIKSLKK